MAFPGPRAANRAPHVDGVLVVDKPVGPTSHDVVAHVRRASSTRRVGHTGTLDPLASGVLPLVLGRATRLARFLGGGDKTYEATVRLGIATDTYDSEGRPLHVPMPGPRPGPAAVEAALRDFVGEREQVPPAYSAKKVGGTPAYRLARREAAVALPPARVTLHAIDVLGHEGDLVWLRLACSAGFYVRSLAHDLGMVLGCGAHLVQLRRTRAGDFGLDVAVPLDRLDGARAVADALTPLDTLLPGFPAAHLTAAGAARARHGQLLEADHVATFVAGPAGTGRGPVRLLDPDGHLLGIAEVAGTAADGSSVLHPSTVLV